MAKKYKAGDKITDEKGVEWRFTQGGHWRDEKGNLFNKGGSGTPKAKAGGKAAGPDLYQQALNTIGGDNSATLGQGLKDIAGGDKKIEAGFKGGAEIGASLFAPGSLGRVDEAASQDQIDINSKLKSLSDPNVDPLLQTSLDLANKTAADAQTLDPRLQKILDLREGALGGLNTQELTATKELAQSGLNQSLTSAVRALRVGQGGSGAQGASANIGTIPLTAQYANSQADLTRKLIIDQYNAQKEARDAFSGDTKDIIGGFQANKLQANQAAGNAAATAINDRSNRFNNYINYNSAMRTDLYNRRLQNLNTIAAEKSGQAASIFGGGSFAAQQAGEQKAFELGKENLDLQRDIFKNNFSSGGGEETTSPGNGNEDTFG